MTAAQQPETTSAKAEGGTVNGRAADRGVPPLLELTQLCAGYGPVSVLRQVSLEVAKGEMVALLGSNGAGKTTTILSIAGILTPTEGTIKSNGKLLPGVLHKRSRQGIGFIFEERGVVPSLSTADNLKIGRGGVEPAVEMFPELKPLLKRRAGLLSGGEQQILTVARALATHPDLLVVDELSLGLAPQVVTRILNVLRTEVSEGRLGVLLVEQRIHLALRYADRAFVLQRGEVVLQDRADRLRSHTDEIAERYFTASEGTSLTD